MQIRFDLAVVSSKSFLVINVFLKSSVWLRINLPEYRYCIWIPLPICNFVFYRKRLTPKAALHKQEVFSIVFFSSFLSISPKSKSSTYTCLLPFFISKKYLMFLSRSRFHCPPPLRCSHFRMRFLQNSN